MLIHEMHPVPVDDHLLEAIEDYASSSPDDWIRKSAWQRYASLAGDYAVGPLAAALEFDESETVRERLVMNLSSFENSPGVASIIDNACTNDSSQQVRYAAQRALGGSCGGMSPALTRNIEESAADLE